MMRALVVLLALLACARATPAVAADDAGARLARLLAREADLDAGTAGGLVRLVLPPAVLAACRPDLSDVRVFDDRGREVPFVVDAGVAPGHERHETTSVVASVLDVRRTQTPVADRPPHSEETYRLSAPAGDGTWTLVVDTRRSGFARRLGVADGSGTVVADAPLVRLDAGAERLRVDLPRPLAGDVTVTITGDEGFFLEPTFRFERERVLGAAGEATVPLALARRTQVPERTVLELVRPPGVVPGLLRVATTTRAFDRRVRVRDVAPGREAVLLADARLVRVSGTDPVDVPLSPARGAVLRLEIDDGDSPPLADVAVTAVLRQPTLLFALPDGAIHATLRFGGGRLDRPRYDVAGLRADTATDAGATLADPARLPEATLGALRPNPAFDATPALAFAMHAGAPVDVSRFAMRRRLDVPASPDGLARVALAPADLAQTRADLADLRVVDDDGRQWPFLLDRGVPPATVDVAVAAPVRESAGHSRYALAPPSAPIAMSRLELDVDAAFFHRPYRLEARLPDGTQRTLVDGTLARDPRRLEPLALDVPLARVETLALVVDDADDAPLALRRARATVPGVALLVTAPAGRYHLLLGDPDAAAPRYELEAARELVAAVQPVDVVADAAEANPDFRRLGRAARGDTARGIVVWAAIGAAVLVLAVLTLRAARA